jgi:hypothetical protein
MMLKQLPELVPCREQRATAAAPHNGAVFCARHSQPRIGRILMARGRDATDVAIVTSFGPCNLASFKVFTEEVS